MSEKHYPYIGGSFDRIVFDGDGSVWVPESENAKLRKLVRGLHMAYVGALNECESLNEGLILEYSGSIDADVARSKARFEAYRHSFDVAMRELGIEVRG